MAVDNDGSALRYDGAKWSAPVDAASGVALISVSCASATFCVALDYEDDAVLYNGSSWSVPTPIAPGNFLTSVSCPSSTFCVAVDFAGDAITYNGSSWSKTAIDPGNSISSVSCPSVIWCIAMDPSGSQTYTGSWAPHTAQTGGGNAVSCAIAQTCVAVGDSIANIDRGNLWTTRTIDASGRELVSVSCPTSTFCVALDDDGYAVQTVGDLIDWSAPSWADPIPSFDLATSVSCASASFCVAVDSVGRAVTYNGATWSAPKEIDAVPVGSDLMSVSCPTDRFCGAVGYEGEAVVYNGSSWSSPKVIESGSDPDAQYLSAISCPVTRFCVAAGRGGTVVTYSGSWSAPTVVDGSSLLNAVSCTSSAFCVAGDINGRVVVLSAGSWSSPSNIDPGNTINSISCASSTFCVAVDTAGNAETYDGSTWSRSNIDGAADITSGACPTTAFCSAVDYGGNVLTYRAPAWSSPTSLVPRHLNAVSCSDATFCVAVDVKGNAFAFNGTSWSKPSLVDKSNEVNAVSCASAFFCVAVDSSGNGVTYSVPCEQQIVADGSYQVSGCLQDGPGGDDATEQKSSIDGVQVSASAADEVDYSTADGSVSSEGRSKVSLVLGSQLIPIFKGDLSASLDGALTFNVPASTKIAGLAISGTLTLTPMSLGEASGSVTVTLPASLGGGTGNLTFDTSTADGVTNLSVSVPSAKFMNLFSLSDVSLSFAEPGTWTVAASASTGGSTETTFEGALDYAGNTLESASLSVAGISLDGLFNLSSLSVSYSSGQWAGQATIAESSGATVSAAVNLSYAPNGSLTSASIDESGPVSLFNVVDLTSFAMSYSGSDWKISAANAADGGSVSASLTATNGVVSAANLSLTNARFENLMTIKAATLSYGAESAAACPTVVGPEVWCGSWDVELPQATVVKGISGTLAISDGNFASGSVDVTGRIPLFFGVELTQLGGSVTINPPPTTVTGDSTITFGPRIGGAALLSLSGQLTRTFASDAGPGGYAFGGAVTALQGTSHAFVVATGSVTVPDSGATTVGLTLGPDAATGLTFSGVTVRGALSGSFTAATVSLTGQASVTVPVLGTLSGTVKADKHGIAACAATSGGSKVGFEYVWSTASVQVFDTEGCSEKGF